MQYHRIPYEKTRAFCIKVFQGYGFSEEESKQITDVLLDADLCGIESHGIQRLIRYHYEVTEGMAKPHAKPQIVKETPLAATIEGNDAMGQTLSVSAMQMAIDKAKQFGIGMV
ncbi:MAG: Ldh family oxidoreductase, partial [Oscillospiraceae bacterium]|nr:Ldh family oxidoreductase [Oscillospiraceae bacterium]